MPQYCIKFVSVFFKYSGKFSIFLLVLLVRLVVGIDITQASDGLVETFT